MSSEGGPCSLPIHSHARVTGRSPPLLNVFHRQPRYLELFLAGAVELRQFGDRRFVPTRTVPEIWPVTLSFEFAWRLHAERVEERRREMN